MGSTDKADITDYISTLYKDCCEKGNRSDGVQVISIASDEVTENAPKLMIRSILLAQTKSVKSRLNSFTHYYCNARGNGFRKVRKPWYNFRTF
jgi:hypothetical protein